MTSETPLRWLPDHLMDETTPPPLPHPSDWLRPDPAGGWRIGSGRLVQLGEVVRFYGFRDLGFVGVAIRQDGTWTSDRTPPAAANNFWVEFDPDTIAPSIEEFVESYHENFIAGRGAEHVVQVGAYYWALTPTPFILAMVNREARFVAVPGEVCRADGD